MTKVKGVLQNVNINGYSLTASAYTKIGLYVASFEGGHWRVARYLVRNFDIRADLFKQDLDRHLKERLGL